MFRSSYVSDERCFAPGPRLKELSAAQQTLSLSQLRPGCPRHLFLFWKGFSSWCPLTGSVEGREPPPLPEGFLSPQLSLVIVQIHLLKRL